MRARPHLAPLPAGHPSPPDQSVKLVSDETRPAVDRVRETLAVGINIQATGEVTNAVVTGMVKCLLDHIDELEADLNCAVAVGRMAAGALKPLLESRREVPAAKFPNMRKIAKIIFIDGFGGTEAAFDRHSDGESQDAPDSLKICWDSARALLSSGEWGIEASSTLRQGHSGT
jgi:hypothetical protein